MVNHWLALAWSPAALQSVPCHCSLPLPVLGYERWLLLPLQGALAADAWLA